MILYELAVGQPPFYTTSIYSLIHQIVRDPVRYPPDLSPAFRDFLQARARQRTPRIAGQFFLRLNELALLQICPRTASCWHACSMFWKRCAHVIFLQCTRYNCCHSG